MRRKGKLFRDLGKIVLNDVILIGPKSHLRLMSRESSLLYSNKIEDISEDKPFVYKQNPVSIDTIGVHVSPYQKTELEKKIDEAYILAEKHPGAVALVGSGAGRKVLLSSLGAHEEAYIGYPRMNVDELVKSMPTKVMSIPRINYNFLKDTDSKDLIKNFHNKQSFQSHNKLTSPVKYRPQPKTKNKLLKGGKKNGY